MTEAERVEVGQAVQQLVMIIDLLGSGQRRPNFDNVVEGPAVDVFQYHPDVLETPKEGGNISMSRYGSVYT